MRKLWLCLIFCAQAAVAAEISDLSKLPAADVVILGEIHDNPIHHVNQAAAVAMIQPKALVFEMLTEAQALAVRPEMIADQAALETALGWNDSGWPDFALYYPIFAAAPDAVIFGGAIDRTQVRRAVTEGAAQVFGAGASVFRLNRVLDDHEQVAREAGQMAAHCDALPIHMLGGMVEAQRLRDAGLARAVVAALAETDGPVVVITGNGHARNDWGIPRMLFDVDPRLSVLSVGQFEAPPEDPGNTPFDLWLVTDPVDRPDPCAVFKQ